MAIKIERELMKKKKPVRSFSNLLDYEDLLYKSKVIINDSTSKAMYSFPLARRFTKFEVDNSSFFYDIPTTLSKRGASIGYGKKSNITLSRKGKSDNIYNLPMGFDITDKNGTPKYTFGFGRDICRKPKCLDEKKTPGPSNYFPYKNFGDGGSHYSMSFRYKYKKEPDNYPGPGTYEFQEFNNRGIYSSSGLRNSQSNKFSKTKRFAYHDWRYPGPGTYNTENLIKGNGIVYNSKLLSNNPKTIGKKLKWIKDPLITPGPGAYEFFSEFQGFNRKNFVKIRKGNENMNKRAKSSYSSRCSTSITKRRGFNSYK